MNSRMFRSFLLMGAGAVLQSIYWITDIFFIGILGHFGFISGLIIFPTTVLKKKIEKERKNNNMPEGESNSCKLNTETEDDSVS